MTHHIQKLRYYWPAEILAGLCTGDAAIHYVQDDSSFQWDDILKIGDWCDFRNDVISHQLYCPKEWT